MGPNCDYVGDFCLPDTCQNNGTCTDPANSEECTCRLGYSGPTCEVEEHFTLQQWKGIDCGGGVPWRCFHLQMDKCINTGHKDGNVPNQDFWFGKITFNDDNHYVIDLCFGENKDDPEESCKCKNHYTKVPKFGKNGLGPGMPST